MLFHTPVTKSCRAGWLSDQKRTKKMRNSFEREMEKTGTHDLGRKLTGRLQYSAFFLNEPNLRLKCGLLGGNACLMVYVICLPPLEISQARDTALVRTLNFRTTRGTPELSTTTKINK